MSVLTPEFEKEGVRPVIIGGSAVEFYTRNWYATGNIDLAVERVRKDRIPDIMERHRFRRSGRMWIREDLGLYVEFPGDIDDLDMDRVTVVETDGGHAYVIGLEDIIFDRIQATEHWKSDGDREEAVRMGVVFYQDVDWEYLGGLCREGDSEEMLDRVLKEVLDAKDQT